MLDKHSKTAKRWGKPTEGEKAGKGSLFKIGFNFIGIELNPEYVLIAEKRLQAVEPYLFNEVNNGA